MYRLQQKYFLEINMRYIITMSLFHSVSFIICTVVIILTGDATLIGFWFMLGLPFFINLAGNLFRYQTIDLLYSRIDAALAVEQELYNNYENSPHCDEMSEMIYNHINSFYDEIDVHLKKINILKFAY